MPSHFHSDLQHHLQTLRQSSRLVDDYFNTMDMNMIQANCNEKEEATLSRFFNGLNRTS